MKKNSLIYLVLFALMSCTSKEQASIDEKNHVSEPERVEHFEPKNLVDQAYSLSYFSGKAEVCSYELQRARYNGMHPGEAVLIFVTEPFLPKQQVKSDDGANKNTVNVLKMNRIDRFTTGAYDYSMFTSVFTPLSGYSLDYPLKITFSAQDWCGQLFTQVNNSNGFEYKQFSYFQQEGDTVIQLEYHLSEDNIFNIARIDKTQLPEGKFSIYPSQSYARTAHIPFQPYDAIGEVEQKDSVLIYRYEISKLKRSVSIYMDTSKHNRITKWTEAYPTVVDKKVRKSTYVLKATQSLPYWRLNEPQHVVYRDSLNVLRY
jgi:hypothetical protein